MKILFILLIIVTDYCNWDEMPEYRHMIWENGIGAFDNEIVDEWKTNIQSGDTLSGGKAHYKAVLFYSKDALLRYLAKNEVAKNSILLDVEGNKQLSIKQTPIMEEVKTEEIKGYKSELLEVTNEPIKRES